MGEALNEGGQVMDGPWVGTGEGLEGNHGLQSLPVLLFQLPARGEKLCTHSAIM